MDRNLPLGIACFCILLTLVSFGSVRPTQAAPLVTSVQGTLMDNGVIVIQGSNFGSKPAGSMLIWDSMESGRFQPDWSETWSRINSDNNRHPRSRYNAKGSFSSPSSLQGFNGGTDSPKWFVQYWFKLGTDWTWGTGDTGVSPVSNVKFFRLWTTGSDAINYVQAWHTFLNQTSTIYGVENGSGLVYDSGNAHPYTNPYNIPKNTWVLFQWQFSDGDVNASNGTVKWWINGKLAISKNNLMTRSSSGGTNYKRVSLAGFYNSWGNSPNSTAYIDDVYVANSWARVELGNAPTYDACTLREIQIPSVWTGTAITIRLNQGAFPDFQSPYLYVVDESGAVNPSGFSLSGTPPVPKIPEAPFAISIN